MRSRPGTLAIVGLVAGTVVVLAAAAALPAVLARPAPTSAASSDLTVPVGLYGALVAECIDDLQPGGDVVLLATPIMVDSVFARIDVSLYRLDSETGDLGRVEPSGDLGRRLGEASNCLSPYRVEFGSGEFESPADLDPFHRHMYDDYVGSALGPCVAARGLDSHALIAEDPAPADLVVRYASLVSELPFEKALTLWHECPPVPGYLQDAVYPNAAPTPVG